MPIFTVTLMLVVHCRLPPSPNESCADAPHLARNESNGKWVIGLSSYHPHGRTWVHMFVHIQVPGTEKSGRLENGELCSWIDAAFHSRRPFGELAAIRIQSIVRSAL